MICLVFSIFWDGCGNEKWKFPDTFQAGRAKRDNLKITLSATGTVQPQYSLCIKAPIVGRVEKILVREGEKVRKGQILAVLSSTERAILLDAAKMRNKRDKSHWEQLIREIRVLSPEDGQIIGLPVVPGQTVGTADTLSVISDRLIVNSQVSENNLRKIKIGQETTVVLNAYPDKPIEGKVHRISYQSTLTSNVAAYEVDVWPSQQPAFMRSGMTAKLVFLLDFKEGVLAVPAGAVLHDPNGQSFVLRLNEYGAGKPQTQTVEIGLNDGEQIEVTAGLQEGDRILVGPTSDTGKTIDAFNNGPPPDNGPPPM